MKCRIKYVDERKQLNRKIKKFKLKENNRYNEKSASINETLQLSNYVRMFLNIVILRNEYEKISRYD